MTAIALFLISYVGIAIGKIPGLIIDRVGIALLGAIAMVAFGVLSTHEAFGAIDLSTILLLYSLMVISAQLRLGGFYTWAASKIVPLLSRPRLFLFTNMLVSAVLSAVLANDIICFAFTPILVLSIRQAGLNPAPFLIGLALSSNIGSAATIIGNPQNMLIGQVGRLHFGNFFLWCGVPSFVALFAGYGILLVIYNRKLVGERNRPTMDCALAWPSFDPWQTTKGILAVAALILLFFTSAPREISALTIAGILLCSRKLKTREILGLVDWHLITQFCALFIVIEGVIQSGHLVMVMAWLSDWGINLRFPAALVAVSTVLSNIFSNVPAVMLLVRFLDPQNPLEWYTLAVSSTFAGNLFILGSIANLIVIEQAAVLGVRISFREHAVVGVPVTILSLIILMSWIGIK